MEWWNEDRTKDPNAPDPLLTGIGLNFEFFTDRGMLGRNPPRTKMSYVEGDKAYYERQIKFDRGAKNEPSNPTRYHFSASATAIPPNGGKRFGWNFFVRVIKATILYTPYP